MWLSLTVSWVDQQFVIVAFSDLTHLLFGKLYVFLKNISDVMCSVALPSGAVVWSAVCDCGIS